MESSSKLSEPIEQLAKRTLGPLGEAVSAADAILQALGPRGAELRSLLEHRNGFYAFESALLVRPLSDAKPVLGAASWNAPALWRAEYPMLVDVFCFAEDLFGNPFAIVGDAIASIDAETGEIEEVAGSLALWAQLILDDAGYWTGWPLAHEWQEAKGAIPMGHRLVPKQPFVLGGAYEIGNLVCVPDHAGMLARGHLARQLVDLPAGSPIEYEIRIPT